MSGKNRDENGNEERKDKSEDKIEIDFGQAKMSFQGIFKGLGSLIEMIQTLESSGEKMEKKGEIEGPGGIKGVYGFNVKTLGGKPVIDTFGNVKATPKGTVVDNVREPLVDVFDEDDHVTIIAEMPGLEEEDIKFEVIGDVLQLNAYTKNRSYSKEILLPCKVALQPVNKSYKNGLFELRLKKEKD